MVQEQSSSSHHHQLPKYGPATGVVRASKKNKPKKIPQRGLGVAQLEKLRLEEQKKKMEDQCGAAVSVVAAPRCALSSSGLGHLLPLHPPPPPPPVVAVPRPPADGSRVHCGFSPVLWEDRPAPDPIMKQQYKQRMPPLPDPMVSTGLSLTAPSSHPTEPPSNQMYNSSISSRMSSAAPAPPAEEDRESAGLVDRSWPFMFEGMTTAAAYRTSAGKAATPTTPPPFAARMVTTREAGFAAADVCPDLMMSRHEQFRAKNYFSSTSANYSDWWSPDFAYCKNSKANACAGEPAFLSLMSAQPAANLTKQPHVLPSSAHPHLPEYSDLGVMQPQGSIAASPPSRPFYSFLPAGPVRCGERRPLGECRADGYDGVDLELKL